MDGNWAQNIKWVYSLLIMVSGLPVMDMLLLRVLKQERYYMLTDQLHAGIHISNPVGGKLGKEKMRKAIRVYLFGLGYEAVRSFSFSAEIEKEDQPVNVNAGFQYKPVTQLIS